MPWSSMFTITCITMLMMRDPPGEPATRIVRPSRVTMVGDMLLNGRLPGAIALASPCTRPNRLGTPGLMVKSSISSFSKNPVPSGTTTAPNEPLMV